MNWTENCGVVIPCLNEAAAIAELVQAVRQQLPIVVVVDDGSSDDTASRASGSGARVISSSHTVGKGGALKIGVRTVAEQGCGFALLMDGDGQHRPEDIPAFLRCAEQTGADLVIGNRMGAAQSMPWPRRAANRWMSRRISKLTRRSLPDTQCGFRLVNLKCWKALRFETDHFEIESDMLVAFLRAGCKVEFVPIHAVGRSSHSKINILTDTFRWLRWWRRARSNVK